MSERVARLRQQSLDAIPTLSTERVELLTEFYRRELEPVSTPVRRALAFRHLMANKAPRYGNDDNYADDAMVSLFNAYFDAVDGRRNTRGGNHHINLFPTTCHIYFG